MGTGKEWVFEDTALSRGASCWPGGAQQAQRHWSLASQQGVLHPHHGFSSLILQRGFRRRVEGHEAFGQRLRQLKPSQKSTLEQTQDSRCWNNSEGVDTDLKAAAPHFLLHHLPDFLQGLWTGFHSRRLLRTPRLFPPHSLFLWRVMLKKKVQWRDVHNLSILFLIKNLFDWIKLVSIN